MSHSKPLPEILQELGTDAAGLSPQEARVRLERDGPNRFPPPPSKSLFSIVLGQLLDPLILVLIFSTFLGLAVGKVSDSLAIIAVVSLNALVGSIQEWRARKSVQSLGLLMPTQALVVRQAEPQQIPAEDLVRGDILVLQPGDQISADARLIECNSLETNESMLTGEALPVTKEVCELPLETPLGDRTNLVHGGTLVTRGTARAVVVATGAASEFGRISLLLQEAEEIETPLMIQMAKLGKQLSYAIVILSAVLLGVARWRGLNWGDSVLAGVTLAVAAVPEGLPAIVTIAFALGVRRMSQKQAIIRHLAAVETLGSSTVICSDKTGTLTTNEMTVVELWTPEGQETDLLRAGALCNDAGLDPPQGDPTELALLRIARERGVAADSPRVQVVPFDSQLRWMATAHEDGFAYFKGAPEVLLPHCSGLHAEAIQPVLARLAGQGRRVLCLARKPNGHSLGLDSLGDLELLGLQAMVDPPRPEVKEAIAQCHRAGMEVKMITGDHPLTASAIAKELGLPHQMCLTGPELSRLKGDELTDKARQCYVFARVEPEQKLSLVKALQKSGQVVVMTGDGVNDAPALKRAEIGVAMGKSGTSVAREAADMVLLDDNFATIVNAVREGRRVYDNLVKALAFLIPTNLALAWIQVAAMAFFPLTGSQPQWPLEPIQILWINLLASVALSLPLAFERAEPDVMGRPPRPPKAPLMGRDLWVRSLVVSFVMAGATLWTFQKALPQGLHSAQTEALTTLVLFQCLYLWICRGLQGLTWLRLPLNPTVPLGIAVVLGLQLLLIYWPPFHAAFRSAPIQLVDWGQSALASLLVIPVSLVTRLSGPGRNGAQK